jgi:hypothetical protein
LVVRKDCLEGHFLVKSRHVASAGRLNLVAFYVCSLILKVQQQPKLETGTRLSKMLSTLQVVTFSGHHRSSLSG